MIELLNVCKFIKGREVLRDVSLSIESGEVVGIKGANGSGKTMLLRAIAGLIYPTSGSVVVDGVNPRASAAFPPSIGLLIENPSFLPHLTGLKNCELLASIKDVVTSKQISQCLMDVGLDPQDTRTFNKYSLGMKQRLGLAAAFMEQPHVVLLDEPTNALDEEGIELLSSLVRKSRERGACIAIASHDALVLETIADKIYLMKEGALQPASSTAIPPVDQQCAGTQAEEAA